MYKKLLCYEKYFGAKNYKSIPVIINRGKDIHLYDINNNKYYDFLSSYSSVNQGHCHPKLVKTMQDQCNKLTLCSRAFQNEKLCLFYKYMNNTFGYDKVLPMNSGVEAGETAIKLARLWGYKKKNIENNSAKILFAKNNFWGRTIAAISSSTDPKSYNNFGPYLPGIECIEYNNIQVLKNKLKYDKNICAFMVEPIQGEAGINIPSNDYLIEVKKLCEKYNILLICDEIQTGLGRTGKFLESESIKPDILLLGKALSGGMMPVSCVLADNEIMNIIEPGTHGSTYGGNPLGMSLVPVAVNIIFNENLIENSKKQGELLRNNIIDIKNNSYIKDVRGKGLLNAIEFYDPIIANKFLNLMIKNKILTNITKDKIIRLSPPLTISKNDINYCSEIINRIILKL